MKLLLYFMLLIVPCFIEAQNVRSIKDQESENTLSDRYGLSQDQIKQYYQLVQKRQQEIARINKSIMSFANRNKQIAATKNQFSEDLKKILSVKQFSLWQEDTEKIKRIEEDVNKIFNEFWYDKMKGGKNLDNDNLDIRPEYEAKIVSLMGDEGKRKFNKMTIYKMTKMDVVQHLKLPQEIAVKFCQQKLNYLDTCRSIRLMNIPDIEKRSNLNRQKYRYESKIKKLIGAEKYANWKKYQADSFDRKSRDVYGFTEDQMRQYKSIQTQLALKIYKIKQDKITSEEKKQMIEEAKAEMESRVKEILSAEQYRKWIEDRRFSEQKRKH